jgi:aerobic-type carbon monoxide dehydrogenase small subunit (CoxS/CutS family)
MLARRSTFEPATAQEAPEEARMKDVLTLRVNGDQVEVGVPTHYTLLETLRYALGLTGSKQGCDKGDCGACTVLLDGEAHLSCIMPVYEALGHEITTVEGLADGPYPHPLQDAFDLTGAAQCGFCTPGILCSAHGLLAANWSPSRQDIQQALSGNLCRCTGYTKIFEAVEVAAESLRTGKDPRDIIAERYEVALPARSMQPLEESHA